jgi:hypothetical protein
MSVQSHGGRVDWGKLPIRPPERFLAILPAELSSSESGGCGRRKLWILSMKYFFHTRRVLLHAVKKHFFAYRKILGNGTDGFTSTPKEGVLWICIALKNP